MSGKNIILDIDVACDLLIDIPPYHQAATAAVEKALNRGCHIWLAAATLPTLFQRLKEYFHSEKTVAAGQAARPPASSQASRALEKLMRKVRVLSSYGFHAGEVLKAPYIEGAFILKAAKELGPETCILSRNSEFIAADTLVISPEIFLKQPDTSLESSQSLPFIDLMYQKQHLLPQIEENICTVLRHGQFIMGPEIKVLEDRLSAYIGTKYCISCSNGTDALLMALMAHNVGPGDAVFTSPFTFIATAEMISLLGATPIFVDIDPRTFNIDPTALASAITALIEGNNSIHPLPKNGFFPTGGLVPKGIIAVDLFGVPADYNKILPIAEAKQLFVIEDAAQSFGARYETRMAGSLAEIGCTSFFPAKPLGCYGDGGAVFTDNPDLAEKIRAIRIHGESTDRYTNKYIGINGRMDSLQAAILLAKLSSFPEEIKAREQVAKTYTELCSALDGLTTPEIPAGFQPSWAQYAMLSTKRNAIIAALKSRGIPSAIYYPKPLHLQKAFTGLGYRPGDFPESEYAAERIFSPPMHPYLSREDIKRIVAGIKHGLMKSA